ncbi:MAG: hypothetical protein ACYC0X_13750 [Pirellulaceae bacterium]
MQLDKTRIVIRERGVFDTLDLALQLCRIYLWPLTAAMCLGVIPCAVVNHWLTMWMVPIDADAPLWEDQIPSLIRFVWTMVVLIVIEAPLASIFVTAYLGKAVFLEAPSLREVIREVMPQLPQIAWCHCLLRGVLPALLLLAVVNREQGYSFAELLLTLLLLAVLLRRMTAPFLNEIVLLEKSPLRGNHPQAMTVRKRSDMLHSSHSGSLIHLGLVMACVAVLLTAAVFGMLLCVKGIFLDDWTLGLGMFIIGAPLSLWTTAGFLAVVRFLAYLDLRISNEGWEVELQMRAEGTRLTGQTT